MNDLTAYEQETIINYSNGDKAALVYTYDRAMIRKLDSIAESRGDIKLMRRGDDWVEYEVPKRWVKINANRILSDEEREARAERMRNMKSN